MTHIHEFALLLAIAVPFLAIVGLNLFLFCSGERGALLLPSQSVLSVGDTPMSAEPIRAEHRVTSRPEAANDAVERKAA